MIYYYLCYYTQNQSIMREYANKPESQSRTLDSNPRASRQAPIADILQAYKNGTLGRQPVQRESMEDDELLQAKASGQAPVGAILQRHKENVQRFATEQEDDLLQGKFDTAQREAMEDDELLQGKFETDTQTEQEPVQREEKPNNTGLPDNLKTGIENLSGYSMDDVKVHYNSDKPAQLNALAYAQGADIHVAPGQEQHLPHEAWHVVQQKQGRVQPTMQMQGVNVNDNEGLEKEADNYAKDFMIFQGYNKSSIKVVQFTPIIQPKIGYELEYGGIAVNSEDKSLLEKGKVITEKSNYKFTIDELSDCFDLEIIIMELDEEIISNKTIMTQALKEAIEIVENISSIQQKEKMFIYNNGKKIQNPRFFQGIPGNEFGLDEKYFFRKQGSGKSPTGRLQATIGLNLKGLTTIILSKPEDFFSKIIKEPITKSLASDKNSTIISIVGTDPFITNIVNKNISFFAKSTSLEKCCTDGEYELFIKQLTALSVMLVEIPTKTRLNMFIYPKSATGNLLHRTDFASIFKLLPSKLLAHLKAFSYTWSLYLLDSIDEILKGKRGKSTTYAKDMPTDEREKYNTYSDRIIISRDTSVLVNNWHPNTKEPHPTYGEELKLTDWYTSILLRDVDLLTKSQYPGNKEQKEWLESVGGFGSKYDIKDNEQRPIFEIRSLLQDSDFIVQAETIWDLVNLVNKQID